MNEPFELSPDECRELLSAGLVGRVAMCTPMGPHIVPVNYASWTTASCCGRRRTASWAAMPAARSWPSRSTSSTTSASAAGASWPAGGPRRVTECGGAEPHQDASGSRDAWAAGQRNLYLRIRWTDLTGRRLGTGWNPADELPVRRVGLNERVRDNVGPRSHDEHQPSPSLPRHRSSRRCACWTSTRSRRCRWWTTGGHLVGVVSEADVLRDAVPADRRAHERLVEITAPTVQLAVTDVMTHLPVSVSPDDDRGRGGRAPGRHPDEEPAGGAARSRGRDGQSSRRHRGAGPPGPPDRGGGGRGTAPGGRRVHGRGRTTGSFTSTTPTVRTSLRVAQVIASRVPGVVGSLGRRVAT